MDAPRIDPLPTTILGTGRLARPEGVAFSSDGRLLAVADANANEVHLHRLLGGPGEYAASPHLVIGGPESGLSYPHDVSFSPDDRLLAVANREARSLTFYARDEADPTRYGTRPVAAISGKESKLIYVDGVAFVPPHGRDVAAANRLSSSVRFFRRRRLLPGVRFATRPWQTLRGAEAHVVDPDGLAFSHDGAWLAVTNHSAHTVTVYARIGTGRRYAQKPVAEIRGAEGRLRFPHSVAFSPDGTHLAVSSAGGRFVGFFPRGAASEGGPAFAPSPSFELLGCDPARFEPENRIHPMDGGPKGIAFGGRCFAVCNADLGVSIHRVLPPAGSPSITAAARTRRDAVRRAESPNGP